MSLPYDDGSTPDPWYPRHASDRADELIDELDEQQRDALYLALKDKTLTEWHIWLEDARASVLAYDAFTRGRRAKKLKSSASSLELHHACIYLELWRARLSRHFRPLPPNGLPIDTPNLQRELMLEVLASSNAFDPRDLWPFEYPADAARTTWFPFKEEPSA